MSLNQIIQQNPPQVKPWANLEINNLVCDGYIVAKGGFTGPTGATGSSATPTQLGPVFGQTNNVNTNVSLGYNSLANNTGSHNTAIGYGIQTSPSRVVVEVCGREPMEREQALLYATDAPWLAVEFAKLVTRMHIQINNRCLIG